MGKMIKMNEMIECRIDESLEGVFSEFQFPEHLETAYIKSNETFDVIENYSLLILNDELYSLNSDRRFRSEELFDVIAYYKKDENNPNDIVNACSVLLEICNKPGVLSSVQINVNALHSTVLSDVTPTALSDKKIALPHELRPTQ